MVTLLNVILCGVALVLLLPVTILFVEVVSAVTAPRTQRSDSGERRRLAVLMPAHNEIALIGGALRSIRPQLLACDRILVVADNCVDETAAAARAEGAEVIIRTDPERRGKGYALDFGVRHLERDPPDIVVIFDADCQLKPETIDRLARLCARTGRPTQALYTMCSPNGAGIMTRIGEFAWTVRNTIRPTGLKRMGMPCQLMGSGMAFPWMRIRNATLATGHIVEDLKLGIDLAHAGAAPLFCPQAEVISYFPASKEGVSSQRTRWEHGHLSIILSEFPRLLLRSLRNRDARLLAMALDLIVPPLALLMLQVLTVWVASGLLYLLRHLHAAAHRERRRRAICPVRAAFVDAVRTPDHLARRPCLCAVLFTVENSALCPIPGRTTARMGALEA